MLKPNSHSLHRRASQVLLILLAALCGLVIATNAYGEPAQSVDANQKIVASYTAIWHEPDAARRRSMLTAVWSDTAEHQTAQSHSVGREAFDAEIAAFQASFPGATVETHDLKRTGLHLVFNFTLRSVSGDAIIAGVDYMRLDDSGKIAAVVGFF